MAQAHVTITKASGNGNGPGGVVPAVDAFPSFAKTVTTSSSATRVALPQTSDGARAKEIVTVQAIGGNIRCAFRGKNENTDPTPSADKGFVIQSGQAMDFVRLGATAIVLLDLA